MAKHSILLVDDEKDFVETLAKRMGRRGLDTCYTYSGEQALALLKDRRFEVAVIDVKMPGIDGMETLQQIKKTDPDIEVIFLTGHASTETGEEGIRKGAFDYMTKPVDFEELMEKVNQALAQRGGAV